MRETPSSIAAVCCVSLSQMLLVKTSDSRTPAAWLRIGSVQVGAKVCAFSPYGAAVAPHLSVEQWASVRNRMIESEGEAEADVALRVTGDAAAAAVKHHEPLIRNQLVGLFAQQGVDDMSSVEAKEKLRQEALKQVQQVLETEEGKPIVEDVLFNNLIVQ